MRMRCLFAALALLPAAGCAPSSSADAPGAARPVSLPLTTVPGARLPRLSAGDGGPWLSWVEPRPGKRHALRYAVLEERGWSAPATVAEGAGWFVNWADFPSVMPLAGGGAAAHWLVRSGELPYAYDVALALSPDGTEWEPPVTPHGDGTVTEHGFVSLFPDGDGIGAVWLDGRRMASSSSGHDGDHAAAGDGAMTLRAGGLTTTGGAAAEVLLDARTCDCCQTAAVVTRAGPVVFYRDRSDDELRDVFVVTRRDDVWGEPRPVARDGWRIPGCPVNGPAADTDGTRIAVAWFTAADDRSRVRAAFSDDAGERFGEPLEVAAGAVLGRVDVVLLADGDAVVSWVASGVDAAAIRYRRIAPDGRHGPPLTLATVAASRSAGFPQLAAGGEGLVFAWTAAGEVADVLSATVPVPAAAGP